MNSSTKNLKLNDLRATELAERLLPTPQRVEAPLAAEYPWVYHPTL